MKKTILSTLIISTTMFSGLSQASPNICNKIEKNSTEGFSYEKTTEDKSEYCLSVVDDNIILKENSFLYGKNEYILKGIPVDSLQDIVDIQNHLGSLHLITRKGEFIKGQVGYILPNNDYLPLNKNNTIELKLQGDLANVEKTLEYDDIVAKLSNGTVMIHSQTNKNLISKGWVKAGVGKSIDIARNDLGSYFILTKRGIFARLKDTDVDLIKGASKRSTYEKNGVFYLFDKVSVRNIPLNDLKIEYIYNSRHGNGITLQLKSNKTNKKYYVDMSKNTVSFVDQLSMPKAPTAEKELPQSLSLSKKPISTLDNVSVERRQDNKENTLDIATLKTNQVTTRDYGVIKLPYKEKVFLINADTSSYTDFVNYSPIISIKGLEYNRVEVKRTNNVKRIYSLKTYKEE